MNPLLSVLMTSYNREQYIVEAIESVLASTYTNFELIIVDDGSKDRTVEIARSYATNDPRITVYINEVNLGDYRNRNKAASYAKGEFIMYVDSDDKTLPYSFEQCIRAMQQFPEAGFGMQYKEEATSPFYMKGIKAVQDHFFKHPLLMIGPGGTILRRSFFERIGRYPEKYGPANDMYFNLKAAAEAGVLFLPFEIIFYRRHDGQEINNTYSYLYNNYCYLRDALNELNLQLSQEQTAWLVKKNKRRFTVNLFSYFIKTRDYKKTREAIRKAGFSLKDALVGIFH